MSPGLLFSPLLLHCQQQPFLELHIPNLLLDKRSTAERQEGPKTGPSDG